ncbi:MAG: M28 family metallopeptidase [Candidatus Hermodarchaeota archaeon]
MDISDLKLHNNKETIGHINYLVFERIAGTKGESKAINYIQKELNKENIENKVESFNWSSTINILVKSIIIFVFGTSVLYEIFIWLKILWFMIILDLTFIVITYILFINFHDMTRLILIGRAKKSKNIITNISAVEKKKNRPAIIFTAHYDSLSSNYPYNVKRYYYLIVIIIGFSYITSTLIFSIWTVLTYFSDNFVTELYTLLLDKSIDFSYVSFLFLLISSAILLYNRERNQSLGSIDNASGISILIELAKILNKDPPKNIDILFLWCGAEEWGLWGSKQFCLMHFDELNEEYDLDKSYNINIDMVGTNIGLINKTGLFKKRKGNEKLINVIETSAKRLNIPLDKQNLTIEPRSDHNSFRSFAKKEKKKMQVCCFLSNKDSKFIHTSRDTPNKCSSKNLNGCLAICYNTIKSLDLQS